jgi:polysaccharide pyruvyl transferase WcaK-like protein
LPADVRPKVARRKTFWNADEACAVYRHARAMVSLEMHSPILALSHGVPALHVRQPEDTAKAQMWRDVGLGDWLFEIDRTRPEDIARALLRVHERHKEARRQAAAARAHAQVGHRDMMLAVRRALGLS